MSSVHSVMPDEVFSAAELAGETGGFCGTALPASLMLSGLGGLFVLGRRRRAGLLAAAIAVGLLAPHAANAQAIGEPQIEEEGPQPWIVRSGSVDFGAVSFDDSNLQTIYGESGNLSLWLTQGFSIRHILGIDFGTGYVRSRGALATATGTASEEEVRLTVLPFTLSATGRLDLFEGQPIVPYASIGSDYWIWRESSDSEYRLSSGDALGGGKFGWHWAVGGQLLLDFFEPEQASVLQSRTGIRDSYLTIEYRETNVGGEAFESVGFGVVESNSRGLDFSGQILILGLRFDFM